MNKVIIIGSGNAGYTAGIYAGRANLDPLILAGDQQGGQLMLTSDVENYPGFPDGILGPDLMGKFKLQAEKFGAKILMENVTKVNFSTNPFKVFTNDNSYEAHSVIISTGASSKWLGIESESKLIGRGVSSCATCDGFFFKDKEICVVGGGDTAMEEALFLTKFAKKVTIIHRRDKLRASKIMQERVFNNKKISFKWNSVVKEVIGSESVEGVQIQDSESKKNTDYKCNGLFIAIGHSPNTEVFKNQIELDDVGYIISKNNTETSIKGVFAAGDVQDSKYRQAVTAAGSGCIAAIEAERYLEYKLKIS